MIRIATAGFQHESNTFSTVPASLERWRASGILEGEEIRAEYESSQSTLAGFFAAAKEDPEVELVPLVFTRLTPMGAMTHEAISHILDRVVGAIRDGGPWDAVLLPQHGAAVAETWPDADGELVRRVRALVGPKVPIGLALDMHANISPQMVSSADVTTVYQTNPHVDAREQALHCARLVIRMVRGEIRPRSALRMPPLLVNILNQGTSDHPMSELLRVAAEQRARPGVLSASVVEGYPYADVAEMGMSFVAIAEAHQALADDVAALLTQADALVAAQSDPTGMRVEQWLSLPSAMGWAVYAQGVLQAMNTALQKPPSIPDEAERLARLALVLAVRDARGSFLSNPDPDVRIEPGQVLIAIGTEDELGALVVAAR